MTPLAPERFEVRFTIGAEAHRKLRQLQDLLRREIPDGDPGAIVDRALTLLLEEVLRRKFALGARRQEPLVQPAKPARRTTRRSALGDGAGVSRRSRHVPADVKRAVWLRDEGRCAFVATSGRRCTERAFLEFHHCEPYGLGGEPTLDNISLRCRRHNVYEAELAFGRAADGESGPGGDSNSPRGELVGREGRGGA